MADRMEESIKKNIHRYKVWISQANYDIEAAQSSFEQRFYEWTCYQSIQSVEKALKAVIVHGGYRPPKTHKLGVLISMSNRIYKEFEDVRFDFRKIESYTFISRYPFVYPHQTKTPHEAITRTDGEVCLAVAMDMVNKITNFLDHPHSSKNLSFNTKDYYFTELEVLEREKSITTSILQIDGFQVDKIILFGSFARQKARSRTSTMDILVIAETELNFIERIGEVRKATKGAEPIIEPLVYTPTEFSAMMYDEGEGFLESAIEEGQVLYDVNEIYNK